MWMFWKTFEVIYRVIKVKYGIIPNIFGILFSSNISYNALNVFENILDTMYIVYYRNFYVYAC